MHSSEFGEHETEEIPTDSAPLLGDAKLVGVPLAADVLSPDQNPLAHQSSAASHDYVANDSSDGGANTTSVVLGDIPGPRLVLNGSSDVLMRGSSREGTEDVHASTIESSERRERTRPREGNACSWYFIRASKFSGS